MSAPILPQAPPGLNGLPDWAKALITSLTNYTKLLEIRLQQIEQRLKDLETP